MLSLNVFLFTAKGTKYVTYSSVIKLMNNHNGARLHSHDIKYGSGSRQQSVTGTETKEDNNSHWIVKGPTNKIDTRGYFNLFNFSYKCIIIILIN